MYSLSDFVFELIPPGSLTSEIETKIFEHRLEVWKDTNEAIYEWMKINSHKDPLDCSSWFWTVYHERELISSARFTVHHSIDTVPERYLFDGVEELFPLPVGSISRLVVSKEYSGLGLSLQIENSAIEKLASLGVKSIGMVANDSRIPSLIKRGYEIVKEPVPGRTIKTLNFGVVRKMLY